MEAEDGHHHPHSHGGSHEEHEGVKERADGVVAEAGTEEIGGEDYVLVSPELIVLDELVRKVHDDGSGAISTFLGRHLRTSERINSLLLSNSIGIFFTLGPVISLQSQVAFS